MDALQRYRLTEAGVDAIKSALTAEAEQRPDRSFQQWKDVEAKAVWSPGNATATCAI